MTSSNPLQQTIEALAKEKGIEPEVVIQAMEEAVLTASRKFYKGDEELKAKFNPENGQIELNFAFSSSSDRKSTRLNSSHSQISYAVFCLKKKNKNTNKFTRTHYG